MSLLARRKQMKANTKQVQNNALEHPTSLKIYLYTRSKSPNSVGIREVQRALMMVSSNTVQRHFHRLEDEGLVEKLPSNRFILTQKGSSKQTLQIPTKTSLYLLKGVFITSNLFLLSFLVTMFVLTLIIAFFNPLLAIIIGLMGLLVSTVISYFQFRKMKMQIQNITNFEKNA